MVNILMVGPNTESKGGIATVIRNFKNYYTDNRVIYFDSWVENKRMSSGAQALFNLNNKIKKEQIDIVHFHVAQKGSFYRKALLAKRVRKQTKVIFHMHASQFDTFYDEVNPKMKKYIRKTLDQLDGVVVLSEEWEQFYRTITTTKITIIENAVEVSKSIQYNPCSKKIITLGRIGKRKGSYDILTLAERIAPNFPEVTFTLYGDGGIDKIEKQIKKRGIKNVYLGGWIIKGEQEDVIKSSLLHLLPSYQEGLPMSILETMSFGIPNLTTTVGGIPQVVKDGENSMSTNPGEIDAMFTRLSHFLKNRDVREFYSMEAYKTIKSNFSLDSYFKKWNEFYEKLD
ncbi:glycosyltransferase family 4 protein [Carnobacterium maltaromaticum]|uniref:glycosyltransferase family 4 protein n=1 Tax=Carnobacterium maltaromaticum TaxID=2751 RepID=UPI001E3510D8|nr:glycosyltransferase family 4 protein [Carnobacterium maltaromaticum]